MSLTVLSSLQNSPALPYLPAGTGEVPRDVEQHVIEDIQSNHFLCLSACFSATPSFNLASLDRPKAPMTTG